MTTPWLTVNRHQLLGFHWARRLRPFDPRPSASSSLRLLLLAAADIDPSAPLSGPSAGLSADASSTGVVDVAEPAESSKDPKKRPSSQVKKKAPRRLVPPKRPMNIMQLVTQDVISEVKVRQGSLSKEAARESFRMAAERYRSLSDAEKRKYVERLDQLRIQYEAEMRVFLDSLTPDDYVNQNEYIRRRRAQGRSTSRRGIPRLDPNAPKRPLNGFMIFCSDLRTNPEKFAGFQELVQESGGVSSITEGSKVIATYWRDIMSEVTKQEYMDEAHRRSELYKQEKAKYDAEAKALSERLGQLKVSKV